MPTGLKTLKLGNAKRNPCVDRVGAFRLGGLQDKTFQLDGLSDPNLGI
jgi:hypothetical protein